MLIFTILGVQCGWNSSNMVENNSYWLEDCFPSAAINYKWMIVVFWHYVLCFNDKNDRDRSKLMQMLAVPSMIVLFLKNATLLGRVWNFLNWKRNSEALLGHGVFLKNVYVYQIPFSYIKHCLYFNVPFRSRRSVYLFKTKFEK